MQKTIIVGNLTADPVKRATPAGKVLATFTVAVNEKHGGQDEATFYNCTAWEKRADPILQYLHKGNKVAVEGRVKARAYKDKSGEPRASLDLTVENCEFLVTDKRGEAYDSDLKYPAPDGMTVVNNEDLPF